MSIIKILSLILLATILAIAVIDRDSRLEERKHIKYFTINKSAEPYREKILTAYKYWSAKTGIKFIEQFKPFRTVVIYYTKKTDSIKNKKIVGFYLESRKYICVFNQQDFYGIVLHEIGHSLGIKHNNNILDIMYPTTDNFDIITKTSLKDLKEAMQKKDYLLFF